MKVFAIGFKSWVELRAYKSAPIPDVDERKIKTKDFYGDVEIFKLKTVHYPGGKVLYTLKSGRLKYLGVYVGDQTCKELTKIQLQALIAHGGFDKLKKFAN